MNPLDQLRDMHLPAAPGLWPLAPGWWVVGVVTVLSLMAVAFCGYRYWRARGYRREALRLADKLAAEERPLTHVLHLMRRTAKAANPHTSWVSLPAHELLERLDQFNQGRISKEVFGEKSNANNDFSSFHMMLYAEHPTTLSDSQREILLGSLRRWVRKHRRSQLC